MAFIGRVATPEQILAFKVSEKANERGDYLLDKNNAGTLTPDEEIELQLMAYLDRKFSLLKAHAAATLKTRQNVES